MKNEDQNEWIERDLCPVCHSKLTHSEACMECQSCGWSQCSEA